MSAGGSTLISIENTYDQQWLARFPASLLVMMHARHMLLVRAVSGSAASQYYLLIIDVYDQTPKFTNPPSSIANAGNQFKTRTCTREPSTYFN